MRFVPVKTADQQAALMLVGVRTRLIKRRTQLANVIRGFAAEFGATTAKGMRAGHRFTKNSNENNKALDLWCRGSGVQVLSIAPSFNYLVAPAPSGPGLAMERAGHRSLCACRSERGA